MLFVNDVLKKCEENGYPITKMGLYYIGKRNKFIVKNGHHFDFNMEKFYEWLSTVKSKAPEGWVKIGELSRCLGVSSSYAYAVVSAYRNEIKPVKVGGGRGAMYVDPNRVKEVIQLHKARHQYEWKEPDEND